MPLGDVLGVHIGQGATVVFYAFVLSLFPVFLLGKQVLGTIMAGHHVSIYDYKSQGLIITFMVMVAAIIIFAVLVVAQNR